MRAPRLAPFVAAALLHAPLATGAEPADDAPGTDRRPVLVELFTSEGCSNCPPADALLSTLALSQPVPGAEVVALSLHVDYWNRLGWEDPYSSGAFSRRQNDYARAFRSDRVYTPQMVVDGRAELLGSDGTRARAAIAEAARVAKARVALSRVDGKDGSVTLSVRVEPLPTGTGPADVLLVITEGGLSSSVSRGENAGRKLEHTAVVRRLVKLGGMKAGAAFEAHPEVEIEKDWSASALSAVAFVQERDGRRVLAVARISL